MAQALNLDVAYEGETLEDAISELTKDIDVTAEVVNERGPGGGWPVVRFVAESEDGLNALLQRYDPDNQADRVYLKSLAEEI